MLTKARAKEIMDKYRYIEWWFDRGWVFIRQFYGIDKRIFKTEKSLQEYLDLHCGDLRKSVLDAKEKSNDLKTTC